MARLLHDLVVGGLKVKAHRYALGFFLVGWRDYSMISWGVPQSQSPSPLCGSSVFFYARSLKLRLDSLHKKSPTLRVGLFFGRDGEIRTHDPLHPMQVRYRAALHPDFLRW